MTLYETNKRLDKIEADVDRLFKACELMIESEKNIIEGCRLLTNLVRDVKGDVDTLKAMNGPH